MVETAKFEFDYYIYNPKTKKTIKKTLVCGSWVAGYDSLKPKYLKYYEIYDHFPAFGDWDSQIKDYNEKENGWW
jgi:hypothetical protein